MMNYLFDDFMVDKRSKHALDDQLFYHVLNKIFSYQAIPMEPFPDPPELATQLNLPETIIHSLYDRLLQERYVVKRDDDIMIYVSQTPSYLQLKKVVDLEGFFTTHGLQEIITVIKGDQPSLMKHIQQWMVINKPLLPALTLQRLHHTKSLSVIYSVVTISPEYLPLQSDQSNELTYLMEYWNSIAETSFTTMVLFSLNLPGELADHFRVNEGISTFGLRSSLLDQNGHMIATFLYVVSPRVFFNTNFSIQS
jgi:DNA-binding transcriptional regulator YhcF (GntR family)